MWILIFQYSIALENDVHSNRSIVVWRHNATLQPMMTRLFFSSFVTSVLELKSVEYISRHSEQAGDS